MYQSEAERFLHAPKQRQLGERSHPTHCCVCSNDSKSRRDLSFHTFPPQGRDMVYVTLDDGTRIKRDRRDLWIEFAKIPEEQCYRRKMCSEHFLFSDYLNAGVPRLEKRTLKKTAVPSVRKVSPNAYSAHWYIESDEQFSFVINKNCYVDAVTGPKEIMIAEDVDPLKCDESTPTDHTRKRSLEVTTNEDTDEGMQIESADDAIHPPDMVCAVYSTPDANQGPSKKSNKKTQGSNAEEDLQSFYSRCLLCTCRPDATPHTEIFSEAGNQLQLALKINKYLNIQIGTELPQRVCESCVEKLESAHELVTSSQRAKIMLQQMRKQIGTSTIKNPNPMSSLSSQCEVEAFEHVDIQQTQHFQIKVEPESSDSNCSVKNSYQPMDCEAVIPTNVKTEILSDDPDSDSSDEENAAHSSEKSTGKTDDMDGPSEEDFVKCPQCPQVIYKGYLAFHTNLIHGELQPVARKVVDERSPQEIEEERRRRLILEPQDCKFCKKQFYSQVLDIHELLRHTEPSSTKLPDLPEADPSRLMQCPSCPSKFFPEFMQGHIAEEHPPAPNQNLKTGMRCTYCDLKISHHNMEEHLDSEHGPNAWRKCLHCRKRFRNTDTDMEVHLFQEHHGGKLLVCRICDERYKKTGKEQAHMQTFLSCKYKCPLKSCKKTFVTSSSYRDHVFFFHPKIEEDMKVEIERETEDIIEVNRPLALDDLDDEVTAEDAKCQPPRYEPVFSQIRRPDYGGRVDCDICKETVKHKYYLIQHKNQVHYKNLPYNCHECGKNYKHVQGLLDHLHRFHMPKEYTCETCGEAFTKRSYATHLKWHERYPNGPPQRNLLDRPMDPVRCGMCNRPARNKYALLTHINSHHLDVVGERLPFYCEPCNKKFINYEYLMQHHYSVHLPKLVCTYCGKLITQNRMSMHLKLHEPDKKSDYKGKKRGRKPTKASKK